MPASPYEKDRWYDVLQTGLLRRHRFRGLASSTQRQRWRYVQKFIKSAVCLIKRAIFENINFRAARCRWLSVGCWLSVGEPVHQGHHPAFSVRHWIGDVDESQPASHSNLQASDFVDFESVGIPILFVEHLVSVK